MTDALAHEILATVDLLVQENMVGRRPWTGGWETYFSKCIEDANALLKEGATFVSFETLCPLGYCNRFLDAFAHMDRHERELEDKHPNWSTHFAHLAALAAEMFSLVADAAARVQAEFLEHPDNRVFTWLLSGYARSESAEADELLNGYLTDDEAWVRQLAKRLMQERIKARQPTAAEVEGAASERNGYSQLER